MSTYHEDEHEEETDADHDGEGQQVQVVVEGDAVVNEHRPPAGYRQRTVRRCHCSNNTISIQNVPAT